MKKAILFLLTICMLIPLVACAETTEDGYKVPDGYQLLSNQHLNYHCIVPDGWLVENSTAMPSAVCSSVDSSNLSVITQGLDDPTFGGKETATERLTAYWEQYGKVDAAILGGFTNPYVNEEIDAIKGWPEAGKDLLLSAKDGKKVEAKRFIYSITRGETTYVIDQTICIYGQNVYLLTLTAKDTSYDLHVAEMTDILNFFQFRV